jgi:hypothetical protein
MAKSRWIPPQLYRIIAPRSENVTNSEIGGEIQDLLGIKEDVLTRDSCLQTCLVVSSVEAEKILATSTVVRKDSSNTSC